MLFALLFSFALAGAPSKPEPVGYVLRGSAQSKSYLVGYEGRYFKCTTRRVCKSLSQGVPFYAMLGFKRSTELIDYVGRDEVLRECMLRSCVEQEDVEAQSQALRPPAAPVLSGPPTPDELAPMLRDMRRQLRKGQAHLDESIMRTYGQQQAEFEIQRATLRFMYERDRDRLMERKTSRDTKKAQADMDYLVNDMNTRFGTQMPYFKPYNVGDTIE